MIERTTIEAHLNAAMDNLAALQQLLDDAARNLAGGSPRIAAGQIAGLIPELNLALATARGVEALIIHEDRQPRLKRAG